MLSAAGCLGGPVRLVGAGIVLDAFTQDDLPLLAASEADDASAVFNPGPPDGDWGSWVARRNDWTGHDHASWAVRHRDGSLLGSVSLFDLRVDDACADIGYSVLTAHRGRGLAAAAVRLACRFGFEQLGLYRVQLYHAVDNPASCRVAQKAGFRQEGTLRQSHVYGDGGRRDEHLHARLRTD